mgnify:CR=1 FL=1
MVNLFLNIYNYLAKRKLLFFVLLLGSFSILAFFSTRIQLEEDISKILPHDPKTAQFSNIFNTSKFLDKVVVNIRLNDSLSKANPDSLTAYAEDFIIQANDQLKDYINNIQAKIEDTTSFRIVEGIQQNLPFFLDDSDYIKIDSLIQPENVKQSFLNNFQSLTSPSGFLMKRMIVNDPVGISFIALKKLQQLQIDENYELYDNFIITKDHKNLLVFIIPKYPPSNTGKNKIFLTALDHLIDKNLRSKHPEIKADYFGATAVSVSNAQQLRNDTFLTQGITLIFLILFLALYFKRKSAPILILIPVVWGALFSLSAISLLKGHISVIALGTGSIVLGIAVNYSLHVFNHFRHTKDIRTLIRDLTLPLTIGSLTTVGGFFCLEFVSSDLLKDLGLFAAFSLIGSSLASLIFLPHLIHMNQRKSKDESQSISWIDKISIYRPEYNKALILFIFILTGYLAYKSFDVGFQTELSNMSFMSAKLKSAEKDLNNINQFSLRSVYLVTEGHNLQQALKNNEHQLAKLNALKSENVISKYNGISNFIISDSLQLEKIKKWNRFWTPEKKSKLIKQLYTEADQLKFNKSFIPNYDNFLNKDFSNGTSTIFNDIRKTFFNDYITQNKDNTSIITLIQVSSEKKQKIYDAFSNSQYSNVVDKQYLTTQLANIVAFDFNKIALMTSLLVFFVLLLNYGRIELTLVSFIPMFISWIWILGFMSIFKIQFNIINIIFFIKGQFRINFF